MVAGGVGVTVAARSAKSARPVESVSVKAPTAAAPSISTGTAPGVYTSATTAALSPSLAVTMSGYRTPSALTDLGPLI